MTNYKFLIFTLRSSNATATPVRRPDIIGMEGGENGSNKIYNAKFTPWNPDKIGTSYSPW